MSPGLYRTLGGGDPSGNAYANSCFWQRKDSMGTVLGQRRFDPVPGAGLSATFTGPLYAEILPTDTELLKRRFA